MGSGAAKGPFRVYEAARQLKGTSGSKNVVIVIDELAWHRFDFQIKGNWIDWERPRFINPDDRWFQFLSKQQKRYPGLPGDLAEIIHGIDSVKIFRQDHTFEFRLATEYSLRRASGSSVREGY